MDPFLTRLVIAFVVGGATVALFTAAAERLGSRVGGLLLSFPIKVATALVLVALNEGAPVAAAVAAAVPAGLAATGAFLGVAVLVLRTGRGLDAAIAAGTVTWLALAAFALAALPARLPWALAFFVLVVAVLLTALTRDPAARGSRKRKPRPGSLGIAGRALFAGVVVAAAVVAARVAGPVVGGLMAVFPSGFFTSLVILQRAHGSAFTAQTARTMLAGLHAVAVYVTVAALAYPVLHLATGTLLAAVAGTATTGLVGVVLRWWDRGVIAGGDAG